MAMEKRANSPRSAEILTDSLNFDKGDRFVLDEEIWIVTEVRKDNNLEMIRIASSKGDDEMYQIESLRKLIREAKDSFAMMDPVEALQNVKNKSNKD